MNMFQKKFIDIYNEIIKDAEYKSKSNNENRVRHIVRNYLSVNYLKQGFPERKQLVNSRRKLREKSQMYYGFAEVAEKNLDNNTALKNLTKAVLFAPHHTLDGINHLSRAFVFRSKILFKMNRLNECLYDIEQAIDLTDSQELRDRRNTIRGLQISLNRNIEVETDEAVVEKELWIHDFCVIREHPVFGRYMESSGIIAENTVFLKEKAEFAILTDDNLDKYCFNCSKPITSSSSYPCVNCIDCIFCSKTCSLKAFNSFHQFDCGIAGYLSKFDNWNLGYRALTSIGIKNIKELNSIINQNTGPFDIKAWISKRKYNKKELTKEENMEQFIAFLSFVDHIDSIPLNAMTCKILIAFEIALLIDEIKALDINDDEDFILLTTILIKTSLKTVFNCFAWSKDDNESIGICICIGSTMFNHSCDPNTQWEVRNGYQTMTSYKRINSGDEITISYGMHGAHHFLTRQNHLRNNYHFTCNCQLCIRQKSRFTPLKCLRCGGTIYYGNENPLSICVDCNLTEDNIDGESYYEYCIKDKIPLLNAMFEQNIRLIQNPEMSLTFKNQTLSIAESIVERFSEIVDRENGDLIRVKEQLETAREFPLSLGFKRLENEH